MHYRLRFTQKYNTGALQNNYILKVLLTVIFFLIFICCIDFYHEKTMLLDQ